MEEFAEDEMSQELKDMMNLGLLDRNWVKGQSQVEAGIKVSQIPSNGSRSEYTGANLFEDEEINQEVRQMIDLGLIDGNLAKRLNKKETKIIPNQMLSKDTSSQNTEVEQFSNKCLEKVGAECNFNQRLYSRLRSSNAQKPEFHVDKSSSDVREKSSSRIKNYKLIPLSSDDQIFKDISADFERCKIERKIKTIQQVENRKRAELFENETDLIEQLHGTEFDLNIRDLYHGNNVAGHLLYSRGLDQHVEQKGLFGRGIYFSDDVRKCMKYLDNTKGSAIYICSVILGDIMEYPKGMIREGHRGAPEKQNGDFYDSVMGNIDGFNEYIIYDNRRCLIKYRIVLEGVEDEDSDIEGEVARKELEEERFEIWKHQMHYLDDLFANKDEEFQNIEKNRLETCRLPELENKELLTEVIHKMPSQQKSEESPSPGTEQRPIPHFPKETEDNSTQLVSDELVSKFMDITQCGDIDLAKMILENQKWDLDRAMNEYYSLML